MNQIDKAKPRLLDYEKVMSYACLWLEAAGGQERASVADFMKDLFNGDFDCKAEPIMPDWAKKESEDYKIGYTDGFVAGQNSKPEPCGIRSSRNGWSNNLRCR